MAGKNFKVQGKSYWCKLLGDPVPNYNEDGTEWTVDLSIDEKNANEFKKLGLGSRIKNKGGDRGDFVVFKRKGNKPDGTPNSRIPIHDSEGGLWSENKSIGNGSLLEVEFGTFSWAKKGKIPAGIKPIPYKVTVLKHLEYVRPDGDKPYVGDNDHGDALPRSKENWNE